VQSHGFGRENPALCDCGQEFVFTVGEQEFYQSHGLQMILVAAPHVGQPGAEIATARVAVPGQMHTVTCADCGARPRFHSNQPKAARSIAVIAMSSKGKRLLRHPQDNSAIIES